VSEELNKLEAQMQKLGKELPQVMGAFMKLDKECVKDGVLSNKIKELIGDKGRSKPCRNFRSSRCFHIYGRWSCCYFCCQCLT